MRTALVVLAVTLAAAGARAHEPAADPAERATAWLERADVALTDSRLADADEALGMAWLYAASPVYDEAWRAHAQLRPATVARWRTGTQRLAAARAWPELVALRDRARAATDAARTRASAPPPRHADAGLWRRATDAAAACVAAAPATGANVAVDLEWPVPPDRTTIADLLKECAALAAGARSQAEQAERDAAARDAALQPLLKGDRLAVYLQLGEPACACGDYAPRTVARAKDWTYVVGPSGALDTYETLTFTFRGDKLINRHLRRAHDRP